ncbi:thermonuclease family protein [Candidatus Avelusimicrobium luingense]|uniref:thermonuclease family protein n=1 Tax=Candidatus Avelusimicrobium luingense TaxID=3416211 RepID=UPI003D111DE1
MSKRIILYVLYIAILFYSVDVLAQGSDLNQNFNRVELASVYDGDTFRVHLACKYGVFCKTIPIRVRGVDCPEIKGGSAETKALAKQAKTFTKTFLKSGKILLRNCGRDKYFRLLCDVKVNGQSLGEELIKAGHAIPYDGGTKE